MKCLKVAEDGIARLTRQLATETGRADAAESAARGYTAKCKRLLELNTELADAADWTRSGGRAHAPPTTVTRRVRHLRSMNGSANLEFPWRAMSHGGTDPAVLVDHIV